MSHLNDAVAFRLNVSVVVPEPYRVLEVIIDDETDGDAQENIGL